MVISSFFTKNCPESIHQSHWVNLIDIKKCLAYVQFSIYNIYNLHDVSSVMSIC